MGMTAINAEDHISYLNEHHWYRKPFRMIELTVSSLRGILSMHVIKEHAFNELIDCVEGHTGWLI